MLVSDSYTLIPKPSTFPSSSFHYPQQVSLEEGRETFTQPNQVDCGPFNNCQSRDRGPATNIFQKSKNAHCTKWFTTAIHNSMTHAIMCSRRCWDGLASFTQLPVTFNTVKWAASNGKLGEGLETRLGMVHF